MSTRQKIHTPASATSKGNIHLVCGPDDFLVQTRARRIVESLVDKASGDFGLETLDGRVNTVAEATALLRQLEEAVATLPMLARSKTVWLKHAVFFGSDRLSDSAREPVDRLTALIRAGGIPPEVNLVVSAVEIDKRRAFYKTIEKLGVVLSLGEANEFGKINFEQLETFARDSLKANGKSMSDEALSALIELTGENYRALASEIDKLAAYVGDRGKIDADDVAAVGSMTAESSFFHLADAIGERDIAKSLKILDRLLFQGENPLALLFALIGRIRTLLLVRDLIDSGRLRPAPEYMRFKAALESIAAEARAEYPADRKFNPLGQHPFVVFRMSQHAARFTCAELHRAMETLLAANQRMTSSGMSPGLILEQSLIGILAKGQTR